MDDKSEFLKKIGLRITELRDLNKISQLDLSIKAGIDERTLRRIESGTMNSSIYNLYKIANVLNIKLQDLLKIF